jgi:hypothetical protein
MPVDHALIGVIVPSGDQELVVRFRSRRFVLGAGLSALGVLMAAGLRWGARWLPKGKM